MRTTLLTLLAATLAVPTALPAQDSLAVELEKLRAELERVRPEMQAALEQARPELEAALRQVAALGPELRAALEGARPEMEAALREVTLLGPELRRELERTRPELDAALREVALMGPQLRRELERVGPELEAVLEEMAALGPTLDAELTRAGQMLREHAEFQQRLDEVAVPAPEAWAPQDPADSLWRAARTRLNDGQYRRAGELFGQIISRHPRSEYAGPAHYYQALALSRLSDRESLMRAREVLQLLARRTGRTTQQIREAEALQAQIDAALQRRGDADAAMRNAERVRELAETQQQRVQELQAVRQRSCEDDEVRMIALQAVMRSNPEGALPVLRDILARTDECAEDLQHHAFMLLGQSRSPEARRLLTEAARSSRTPEAQAAALMFLSEADDPAFLALTLELLRTSSNEDVQGAALMSLQRSRSPQAREALRTFIRRPGTDEDTRAAAVMFLGQSATEADLAFLRQLYPTVQEEDLKQAILMALMQRGGAQDTEWLMGIATNPAEDEDVRQMALMTAGQSRTVGAAQLAAVYDASREEDMRQHVVMLLGQRMDERAAVDKLLAIARDTTSNADVRRHVILMLSRSDDPRVQQALLEIIRR